MEYLYLIRSQDHYKIGVAGDIRSRMASLQTGNPYRLELVDCYAFPNAEVVERALHQKYGSIRMVGEWFHLTDTQLDECCSLAAALGGVRTAVDNGITNADVEEAEEVQETLASPNSSGKWDYLAMFGDGWRMAPSDNRRRYWTWRRRQNGKDETMYGGTIETLPFPIEEMRRKYGDK